MKSWNEEYVEALNTPPIEGQILKTLDGKPTRLDIDIEEGKQPFVYGRAFVPSIVGCEIGWFVHSVENEKPFGLKCVLLPNARESVLKEKGIHPVVSVTSLKVVRWAESGKALLCEVHEL